MMTSFALAAVISTFVSASLLAQTPPSEAPTQTPAANSPGTNRTARPVQWVNPKLPEGPGLTHHILKSSALGHEVGYVVWTPPDYDANANANGKYPVVYFLHGSGGTESADAAGFSGWVAKGIKLGLIPPVLLVFPNGGMSGYRGDVAKMIVGELIPLIDKNYPILAKPESRALAGFSMGGSGAVRLTIENPELFAAAASMGGGANAEMESAAEKSVPILKQRHVGFLLINGEKDRPTAFEKLATKLNNAGIEATVIVHPNLAHNLGLYYELSNERMMKFLGDHLKR